MKSWTLKEALNIHGRQIVDVEMDGDGALILHLGPDAIHKTVAIVATGPDKLSALFVKHVAPSVRYGIDLDAPDIIL